MTAEIGTLLLTLALAAALIQGLPLAARAAAQPALRSIGVHAAWLQALLITLAFATLITLRIDSDFSVANVAQHSNLALPLLYKITGSWGNHEGSMLLWIWVMAMCGLMLSVSTSLPRPLVSRALAIQGLMGAGFLLFILLTSNPFARLFPPPPDGAALNPLLQDVGLAIHPPMLYGGYVGFSVVFSLAVSALLQGGLSANWAAYTQRWILFSWSILTLGIGLGSWWAYRELGWGGWWFWDPVENASLLPWLTGTALLHANIVLLRRHMLARWVLLLSIITFGFSLLGTFLVRSGVLTSVHSFASDPARGIFILSYIAIVMGSALLLFGTRLPLIEGTRTARPMSREGMLVLNNLLLLVACATVALGTLYPIFAELLHGEKITLGAPYFNRTFLPLMILPLLLAAIAPLTPWKHATPSRVLRALQLPLLCSFAVIFLLLAAAVREALMAAAGFGIAAFLAAATLLPLLSRLRRRHPITAAQLSVTLAHLGAALLIAGITGHSLWQNQAQHALNKNEVITFAGHTLRVAEAHGEDNANYHAEIATLERMQGGTLQPELREYKVRSMQTSEAAILSSFWGDLYAVLGRLPDGRQLAVRLYDNPMISFIWAGFILMAFGGVIPLLWRKK